MSDEGYRFEKVAVKSPEFRAACEHTVAGDARPAALWTMEFRDDLPDGSFSIAVCEACMRRMQAAIAASGVMLRVAQVVMVRGEVEAEPANDGQFKN